MKRLLYSRRGEGYIDMCVFVVVFVMIIVLAMNIFSVLAIRSELDEIADELTDVATYTGAYGSEFDAVYNRLQSQRMPFYGSFGADSYYNINGYKVQLGDTMRLRVTAFVKLKGLGVFSKDISVTVIRTGVSQHYWK